MTYNPKLLKPYLEAKFTNNIPFKNKELYMLCGCEDDNHKAAIRSLKSRFLKEFESKKNNETMELLKLKEILKQKKSNDYTTQDPKYQFHEQKPEKPSENHIIGLIKKYPELPLFMYSKLYERIKNEYVLTGSL
ncbi:hypothetical protein LCGC14_0666540 [marine sediment metagenome]|uniref:Uncharacterized protein n=1 Tax=marine sediment metagenome TaxID=412755 RepID=A0A0F9U0B1_9ZZZZ